MADSNRSSKWNGRVLAIISAAVVIAITLTIGFVFTNAYGISEVAGNARSLHWTNAAIGSAGIARASVAQAVFFSFDERLGVSSAEARNIAIAEAQFNLDDVREIAASPDAPSDPATVQALASLIDAGDRILVKAEAGSPDLAEKIRVDEFETVFDELASDLDARQSALADSIALSEQVQGRLSRVTQLIVTLLIPGVAMVVFWLVVRRRVRAREIEMNAKLEAERDISRAKDDFIAGLSHELRTPLTTIVGFTELLMEGDLPEPDADEMLRIINAGSSDLSRMVEDLLVAARIDAGALTYSPQRMDLATQAESVVAPYTRAGETIDVRVPPIDVYADPLHVRQILHNLVSNARRHGGDRIIVTGSLEGTRAMLVVADDGEGVPPHVEENLFERFVNRGNEVLITGSVGLGLAICRELARGLGGSIHYARIDGWTTFTLRLRGLPKDAEPLQGEDALAVGVSAR